MTKKIDIQPRRQWVAQDNQDIGMAYLTWLATQMGMDLSKYPLNSILALVSNQIYSLGEYDIWKYPKEWDTLYNAALAIQSGDYYNAPYFFASPGKTEDGITLPSFYDMWTQQQKLSPAPSGVPVTWAETVGPEGYRYFIGYDENGNPVDSRIVEAGTPTGGIPTGGIPTGGMEGITPYEQAQLDLRRQELKAQLELRLQELELERQQTAAELGANPRDWIKYWIFVNQPQTEIESLKSLIAQVSAPPSAPNKYYGEIGNFPLAKPWELLTPAERGAYLAVAQERAQLPGNAPAFTPDIEKEIEAGFLTTPPEVATEGWELRPGAVGPYPVEMPTTPQEAWATYYSTFPSTPEPAGEPEIVPRFQPGIRATLGAPSWLPQFVEGLTAGQPILQMYESAPGQYTPQPLAQLPVKTPSGQLWSATPYSVQQGLMGYADWAMGSPGARAWEDIATQMAMMQPVTPAGVTNPYYRPRRQWA